MGEREEFGEFVFDLYIASAGPYWGEPFRLMAQKVFAEEPTLPAAARGWTLGALMVRTGLHLCEQRDPGLYHDFLVGARVAVLREADDRIGSESGRSRFTKFPPEEMFPPENWFMGLATDIIERGIVGEPRAVAWALICEGLHFCETCAAERYPPFLLAVAGLMGEEIERAESWPRRILPRAMPERRAEPRVLPSLFNMAAAGPPAGS